jgi:hypothetical protein
MPTTISKSAIQSEYQRQLENGLDDWAARTRVIDHYLEVNLDLTKEERYFLIQTVWNLCG